ncbi:Nudix hydrolase [Paenibacillus terrae HPL-003]|uniref:Nudix hydrolase n=1 Tax=Paenibacillus terrae (strain HPL-003) TaxID=985665 RepID=G7VW55_PAETH|nr:NUDIX domain-containing protein [Paenibacillus terrae]AET58856.1 Nudix hydrolase [Paenibacillus terrae HPL-003]
MTSELLDIYDDEDKPLGTASRQDAHAKGYWHHTFHCWLARDTSTGRRLLFQQRQDTKDTFPGYYDITAAGHLTAGEDVSQAARELEEELGIHVPFTSLTPLMTVRHESKGTAQGTSFWDREVSSVFGLLSSQPLEAYRLQQEEVAGLYEADLEQALALFEGRIPFLEANGISSGPNPGQHRRLITSDQFVPHKAGYITSICRALMKLPAR